MKVRLKSNGGYPLITPIGSIVDAKEWGCSGYDCKVTIKNYDGKIQDVTLYFNNREVELIEDEQQPTDTHYNNENGSLYLFAEQHGLNAWEFDIIKRITRCRKKGQFIEDLEKTKRVIDLYIKEYDKETN